MTHNDGAYDCNCLNVCVHLDLYTAVDFVDLYTCTTTDIITEPTIPCWIKKTLTSSHWIGRCGARIPGAEHQTANSKKKMLDLLVSIHRIVLCLVIFVIRQNGA